MLFNSNILDQAIIICTISYWNVINCMNEKHEQIWPDDDFVQ